MKDRGECFLAIHELIKASDPRTAALLLLKKHGAPIIGYVFLRVDPNYDWQTEDTPFGIKFKWKRRFPDGEQKVETKIENEKNN